MPPPRPLADLPLDVGPAPGRPVALPVPGREDLTWTAYDPWPADEDVYIAGLLKDDDGGSERLAVVADTRVPELDALASHVAWHEGAVLVRKPHLSALLVIPIAPLTEQILIEALGRAAAHGLLPATRRGITLPRLARDPRTGMFVPR